MYFLLAKGLAVLVLVAGLLYGWHVFTESYRAEGRAEVTAKWNADIERRREQTTAITLAWDQQRIKAETAAKGLDDERAKRFAEATQRARALPAAVAAIVIPGVSVGVLQSALGTDTTEAPEPSGTTPTTDTAVAPSADSQANSTVGLLTEWGVEVINLYDVCRTRVGEWQTFYRGLQAAQPKEETK